MGMRLVVARTREPAGFRLTGELDVATAPQLTDALEPALRRGGDVTLDLSDLSFVDSTRLQGLIGSALSLDGNGRILLRPPGNLVRAILELAIHTGKIAKLGVEEGQVPGRSPRCP